jgi:hypothetical protein
MTSIYTIKPVPKRDELLIAYVSRLAYRNGFDTLRCLLRVIDITPNKTMFRIGTHGYYRLSKAIADSIEMDVELFRACFSDQASLTKVVNKYLGEQHITRARICAKCLSQNGYVKAEWMNYHNNQCHEHECDLINECPRCKSHFNWCGSLLKGCTHCDLTWEEVALKYTPIEKLTPLTKAIRRLSNDQEAEFFESLYYCLSLALRPYDAEHGNYRNLEMNVGNIANWKNFFDNAYALQSHPVARYLFFSARKKNWIVQSNLSSGLGKSSALIHALDRHMKKKMGEFRQTKICSAVLPSFYPNKLKEVNTAALSYNKFSNQNMAPAQLALSPDASNMLLNASKKDVINLMKRGLFTNITHANNDTKSSGVNFNEILNFHRKIAQLAKSQENTDNVETIDAKTAKKYIRKGKGCTLSLYELILSKAIVAIKPANDASFTFDMLRYSKGQIVKRVGIGLHDAHFIVYVEHPLRDLAA